MFGAHIKGTITRIESKQLYVLDETTRQQTSCSLRGKFKHELRLKRDKLTTNDVVAVGDTVEYLKNPDGSGIITQVGERRNFLSRKAPRIKGAGKRGERMEQILVANIDCFYIVVSVDQPLFNHKTLDRFLIVGESASIDTAIIINKADFIADSEFLVWRDLYEEIGYQVFLTTMEEPASFTALRARMKGKKNVIWGPSGVGKSTVINQLYPHLAQKTGEISDFSNKGKHTTVTINMLSADETTFIIDTPGVREIEPFGIEQEDLAHYFREFVPFINDCKYNRCTHNHEPGCAIIESVENGEISLERYESYLRLLDSIEDDLIF